MIFLHRMRACRVYAISAIRSIVSLLSERLPMAYTLQMIGGLSRFRRIFSN